MSQYSHCDSYYVNTTKFTYWSSVYDGLTDTLIVNVIVFLVSCQRLNLLTYLLTHTLTLSRSFYRTTYIGRVSYIRIYLCYFCFR